MKNHLKSAFFGIIVLMIVLSFQNALADESPLSLDYVQKTENGYEISVTLTEYYAGSGGSDDTFELIYNGKILDSKTGWNGFRDDGSPVEWVYFPELGYSRQKATFSAVFHLPLDTPTGQYTVKLSRNWGGPLTVVDEVTFNIEAVTPTDAPTIVPTVAPADVPTEAPTSVPTTGPSAAPTGVPTDSPTAVPTAAPTTAPTSVPTVAPTTAPIVVTPSPTSSAAKKEWRFNQSVCSLGLPFKEMKPGLTNQWYTFTPIDLSISGKQEIKLIAANISIVGKVTVEVKGDSVKVSRRLISPAEEVDMLFTFLPDLDSVSTVDMKQLPTYQFGQEISIDKDLQGDTNVLLYVLGHVNYEFENARFEKMSHNSSQYQKLMNQLKQQMMDE